MYKYMKKPMAGLLAVFAVTAYGCKDDDSKRTLESKDVAERTAKLTSSFARSADRAAGVIEGMTVLDTLTKSANVLGRSLETADAGIERVAQGLAAGAQEPVSTEGDVEEVNRLLRERIFTEANIESTAGESAVFRIQGDDLCGAIPDSAEVVPRCTELVDRAELRIQATLQGEDGLDLTFLLGPSKNELVMLLLRPDSVAAQMDLAQAKQVLTHLSDVTGEAALVQSLPKTMLGRVELKLSKNGEQDLTFSLSLLEALKLELEKDGGLFLFESAARSPLTAVRVEAEAKRLGFELNLGPTTLSFPHHELADVSGKAPQLQVSLAGATMSFLAEEGAQALSFAHVGLGEGTSTVKLDDTTLFSVDVNPGSQRHFDLSIKPDTDGLALVQFTPELDVAAKFFLQPLSTPQSPVPNGLAGEGYRLHVGGSSAPTLKVIEGDAAGNDGGLKVLSGTLTLQSSREGSTPVVVEQGACLFGAPDSNPDVHPVLGQLAVRRCP